MAASTLSFGMLAPRAFCRARRSAGLSLGFGPPAFTAMAMSLLMRVKTFAILFHRANMVALRVSKMRPMDRADTPRLAPAQVPRELPSSEGGFLQVYGRQQAGVLALVATFLAVVAALAFSFAETVEAHGRVIRTLELEGSVTSFR